MVKFISLLIDIHMTRVVSKNAPANSKKSESRHGYLDGDEEEVIRGSCSLKIFQRTILHQNEQLRGSPTDNCHMCIRVRDLPDHHAGNIFS